MQTILVVDEARATRDLLGQLLRLRGYDVIEAGEGRQALALLREFRPDLVILEALLPYTSGFEVCATLKRQPRTRSIPVLMTCSVTRSLGRPDDYWRDRVHADEFLSKPFDVTELFVAVERLLSRSEPERNARLDGREARVRAGVEDLVVLDRGVQTEQVRETVSNADAGV
jgi:DNA-binding response OmpR family regulator